MSEHLAIHTFGGLRFMKAGQTITEIGSRKVEALFLYLALADRPQPRELLADLLWDDRSQGQAMANLRRVLSGVRKHFGPYVEITRTTAALASDSDIWLDARELRSRIAPLKEGRGKMTPEVAARVEEGIDLYQGDFLAGFYIREASGFEAWLTEEREYWRNLVLEAAATLAVSYEEAGMFPEGIALARRALQIDPFQEATHRQLMRLFTLSGRRTDAITQYENCRLILWDELGVAPSPETKSLFDEIARGELVSQASDRPSTPAIRIEDTVSTDTVEKRGIPQNLPLQTTPFIGREKELNELEALLAKPETRLVTIVGPGGMGKTRLAIEVATRQSKKFQDGVYFVPLAPVSSPDKIPIALAEQLEFMFYGSSDPADQILEYLGSQRTLLIFDNFEHLMSGAAFIAAILQHAPNVTILVTSRERLLIAGEAVLWLGGLSFPEDVDTKLTDPERAAAEYGAIGLFLYHARLTRSDLAFDPAALVEVARICILVQGMPLAIILAASWVEALSLDELGNAIASSVDILAAEQRDLPPRQRSIRAAFEASWERLAPADQAVFARLSVFRGGFIQQAAEVVAGANLFTLRRLIEKSLITPPSQNRYEVHELLRQFAGEKLAESGETEKAQEAHGQHYLGALKALEADIKGGRQVETFKEIDADLDNIQRAWGWALEQDQFSLIDASLETLTVFCFYSGRANEVHRLFQAAREKLDGVNNERLLGRLLARHAWLKSEYGLETDSIEPDLDRSWVIAERSNDQREMAQVHLARGYYLIRIHGDRAAGLGEFERAFQICKWLDNRFYMAILLGRIGYCHPEDPALLIDFTRQSLALALETGNDFQTASAKNNLGGHTLLIGDLISSEEYLNQSLAIYNKIASTSRYYYHYFTSTLLALAGFLRGDLDQMKKHLPPQNYMVSGKVNPITIAYVSALRALLSVVIGDLDMAEQLARQSLIFPSNYNGIFLAHWALAMTSVDRGDLSEASQQLSVAYRLPEITAYRGMATRSLPVAALVLAKSGQPERAAQVLSLAQNHPAIQIGWLRHWPSGAALRAELEATLGTPAFQKAWEQGKTLDLVETIEHLATELEVVGKQKEIFEAEPMTAHRTSPTAQPLVEPLSERELEVLRLVAMGKSNREIARELILALGTVKSHLHNILQKLDARSRTEAVARAREIHLL